MSRRIPPERRSVNPMPPDIAPQPSASPRVSASLAGLMVEGPSARLEYERNRDMLAALEADPKAARRLDRNRLLIVLVPLIAFIALLLIVLMI